MALAASPLVPRGTNGSVAQRAEAVRALLRRAASEAFGATPAEAQLHEVLERAYFDLASHHARHAAELHLSRATYFRRLRRARDRLVTALADPGQAAAASHGRRR